MTTSTSTSPAEANALDGSRSCTAINVSRAGDRVRIRHLASAGPNAPRIRPVVLAATDSYARISLVPEGALLLAGDDVLLKIAVEEGVRLELVEPAGTVAYDMRGGSAAWRVEIEVANEACLVWHGEPFVVAHGAVVERRLKARIAPGARLALRETLALGRHEEPAGAITQASRIERPDGSPVLVDGLQVSRGRAGLALGDHRIVESVLLIGTGLPVTPEIGTVLELDEDGLLWRSLADAAHRAAEDEVWRTAAREALS